MFRRNQPQKARGGAGNDPGAAAAHAVSLQLAGSTVLQIVPSLNNDPHARTAIEVARALRAAGARAIVASAAGPLTAELKSLGGEWIAFDSGGINPLKLRRNAAMLEKILAAERIDIVHAYSAGAARSALAATKHLAVWLVTTLPDVPPAKKRLRGLYQSALGRGDRVIAHSSFTASLMIGPFKIPRDRITVIPHAIDPKLFDPETIRPERIGALRKEWKISDRDRIVLVSARMAPGSGQLTVIDAAARLVREGLRGVSFVLLGDVHPRGKYARMLTKRAHAHRISPIVHLAGPCSDLPAALAAADVVVVPSLKPPIFGKPVPEAQFMGRPVIASAIGILPENMLAPPRMPDELRTGWLVPPGNHVELAGALNHALNLDGTANRALAARARQFADFMFSPQRSVAAQLGVYTMLLESGR